MKKPLAVYQINTGYNRGIQTKNGPTYHYAGWLTGYAMEDHNGTSFFLEHRRKTFSDVCHAKYLTGENPDLKAMPFTSSWGDFIPSLNWRCLFSPNGQDTWENKTGIGEPYRNICGQFSNGRQTYWYRLDFGWGWYYGKPGYQVTLMGGCAIRDRIDSSGRLYYKYINLTEQFSWDASTGATKQSTVSNQFMHDLLESVPRAITGVSWPSAMDIIRLQTPYLSKMVKGFSALLSEEVTVTWRTSNARPMTVYDLDEVLDSTVFQLHEPDVLLGSGSDILFGRGFVKYWREELVQTSYLDAIQRVPRMSENNVSNILDIVGFIYNLVINHKVEIPKNLADAWLAYRYVYSTTKADYEQAIEFMDRSVKLGDWTSLKCYGTSYLSLDGDVDVTCRTTLKVIPKTLDYVGEIWRALTKYGLSPSFYMVWDMIPYSFIVDWFIPVGRLTEVLDAESQFTSQYDVVDIIYSLCYTVRHNGMPVRCYTRWLSTTPPSLNGFYFLEDNDPSQKTIVKRILDVASLTLG